VNDELVTLVLWDSACGEDYASVRPRAYPETDFFVFCFALNDPTSLNHLTSKWRVEIGQVSAGIVLVGTKLDVKTMTDKEVSGTRKALLPRYYIETSAVTGANVSDLFGIIARIVVQPEQVPVPVVQEVQTAPPSPPPRRATEEKQESVTCLLI
jgi:GTPase SAR1 family protein